MKLLNVKNLSLASAVAMTLGIPLDSSAAVFVKIGDIKGEANTTTKEHKDWINVLSWSWGMSTGDRGKTCVQDINLMKMLDSATDDLAQSIPAGTVFPEAQLVITAIDPDVPIERAQYDKLVYDMKNVRLTSFSTSGSDGGDTTESLSISFDELTGTYKKSSDAEAEPAFIIPGGQCK